METLKYKLESKEYFKNLIEFANSFQGQLQVLESDWHNSYKEGQVILGFECRANLMGFSVLAGQKGFTSEL